MDVKDLLNQAPLIHYRFIFPDLYFHFHLFHHYFYDFLHFDRFKCLLKAIFVLLEQFIQLDSVMMVELMSNYHFSAFPDKFDQPLRFHL
jgi:hypothetical protein